MERDVFAEKIGELVRKHAPTYGICVCSPIIGQAILESAWGTDYKATFGHNYFGLKYRENRVPISCGKFLDGSAEQNADGSYVNVTDYWFKFSSMEDGVIGYFQFTSASPYSALKGVTDPRDYLEKLKAAKYATSINYVDNVMRVVDQYGLRRFDEATGEERKGMVVNVHAGHNPDGKVACGAVGLILESTEARKVKDAVITLLRNDGHTVYDCTCEDGSSQSNVLSKIVTKCNAHSADLDVSIHFNSGANDKTGNGKSTGVEVLIYGASSKSKPYAEKVCAAVSELGFKNRGVKERPDLYVLKNTKAPAMLIECCFVDDRDDVQLYDTNKMAAAIFSGITGKQTVSVMPDKESEEVVQDLYRVQVGAYRQKGNAEAMVSKLKVAGFDAIIVKA